MPALGEAARRVRRLPEDRRADDEDRRRTARASRAAAAGRPGERRRTARWSCGKPGARAERLLEDRRDEPLGERHERRPRLRGRPRPRRRRSPATRAPRGTRRARRPPSASTRCRTHDALAAAASSRSSSAGRVPVVHRHDHERRPALRRRLRGSARSIAPGTSCAAHGLLDPDRILAGEPVERPGEERLEREVPAVLLADDDDERRAVHARGRERADGVAEPGRRVQERERRLAAADRVARSPARRPAASCSPSTKRRSSGSPARNGTSVEPGFANSVVSPRRRRTSNVASRTVRSGQPQTSSATSTIRRSFAHCSPRVSALPSTVEEKPHCGERQSCSSRRVLRRLLDPALQLVLRLELAALRRHEPEHDVLVAFRQEAQRLEAARALVVPLHEEAVDLELVEERLGNEVVARLRPPTTSGSSRGTCAW